MSELRTLSIKGPEIKKKLLCWIVTTAEGARFSVKGTAVALSEETTSAGVYDGNDLILHNHDVVSVMLQDTERVVHLTPEPKVKAKHKKKAT